MRWFKKRPVGQKALFSDETQKYVDTVRAHQIFTNARDVLEERKIVKEHPELLSELTDQYLTSLSHLLHERGDEEFARRMEDQRNLFRQCRESGVDRAFSLKR